MRRWMIAAVSMVAALAACVSPALGQNNSLGNVIAAAKAKRVVMDGIGDSTICRDGMGHSSGIQDALTATGQCAGILIPPNQTSGDGENGLIFVRRRANPSSLIGPLVSATLGSPGYPTTQQQYGVTVPTIGIDSPLTTTLSALIANGTDTSMSVTTIANLANPAGNYTAYVQIDSEIIGYTTASANPITITRGAFGTTATSHANGATIKRLMLWEGPTSAVLQVSTLTAAITDGVSTAAITVTSTAGFLDSGHLRTPTGEVISYTGRTATTFTGIGRSVFGVGTAQGHAIGQPMVQTYFNINAAGMMGPNHPMGSDTAWKSAIHYKSLYASTSPAGQLRGEIYTQTNYDNTLSSFTSLGEGSAGSTVGTLGTLGKVIQTLAQPSSSRSTSPNQTLTINFGTTRGSNFTQGLNGGCAVMYVGLYGQDRPAGWVQNMFTGRGGFTLNTYHRSMNYYDSVASLNELRAGMVERYKVFRSVGDADVGGNGGAALAHFTVFGHNETGGQGYAGVYQPGYAWTESPLASTGLVFTAPTSDGAGGFYMEVDPGASLRATKGSLYVSDGFGTFEYVTYETSTLVSGQRYRLDKIARGQFGTSPQAIAVGWEVRQGFLQVNPRGFASDVLFDYLWRRQCWVDAGGSTSDFYYIYVAPIPTSASPAFVADDSAAVGDAQREYKLQAYVTAIRTYCGGLPGFILVDPRDTMVDDEFITNDNGSGSADNVHHTRTAYRLLWGRLVGHFGYGEGSGTLRGNLRGRPRRGVRKGRGAVGQKKRAACCVRRAA